MEGFFAARARGLPDKRNQKGADNCVPASPWLCGLAAGAWILFESTFLKQSPELHIQQRRDITMK